MLPYVAIVWVNYNSSSFLSTVLESLRAVGSLDYPRDRYELIVVDNGSTDGSAEAIRALLPRLGIRYKFIELGKNYGFCKAVNEGFRARSTEATYLAVLNNDAVPEPDSLREMVELAESDSLIAAVQGVVTDLSSGVVAEMGFVCSELLTVHALMRGAKPSSVPPKPIPVTYVSGCYSIYRIDALKRVWRLPIVYPPTGFAYFDDLPLGLALWSAGHRCVAIPRVCARHRVSSSFQRVSSTQVYLIARGLRAIAEVCGSSRARALSRLAELAIAVRKAARDALGGGGAIDAYIAGLRDGSKLGRDLAKLLNVSIDLSSAPVVRIDTRIIIYALSSRKKLDRYVQQKYLSMIRALG